MAKRSGKMLVLILAGLEEASRALQGLKFALHTEQTEIMADVEILFFGSGVQIFGDSSLLSIEARKIMAQCQEEGLVIKACSGNLNDYKMQEAAGALGVEPVGVPVYIPARIRDGYQVITF